MRTTKEKTMKTQHVSRRLRRFGRATEAVSALEYAILVGVIAVAVAGALGTFGGQLTTALGNIAGNVVATTTNTGTGSPAPAPASPSP